MLVAAEGPAAFAELRDKTGPFMFMDTYAQPSMEGMNLKGLTDVNGKKHRRCLHCRRDERHQRVGGLLLVPARRPHAFPQADLRAEGAVR